MILVALFWLLIFNQQRLEWTVNAVYSYGWAVPFLAGFLFWERWRRRPLPGEPLKPALAIAIAAVLLIAYLPTRVIQEANPDWVKINWGLTGLTAGVSLVALAAIGGVRYSAYFAFPILFCFTALPWPVWMETYLIQELMRGNASICAEILTMCGIPALAEGNLIQIANHRVNVEEACSGIRSLQTAFMMSLFLGEFHRLSIVRRAALMLASFGVAFLVNLLRTLLLTYLTGQGTADKWHDTVGTVGMLICLATLWGISEWIRPKGADDSNSAASKEPWRVAFPIWFVVAGCVWLASAEAVTHGWYIYHEKQLPPPKQWHVAFPREAQNYREGKFPDRTLALLKFNRGGTADWIAEAGYHFQMYYLDWDPGRVSKFLSSSHYPTVCMPATGLTLVKEMGVWDCKLGELQVPFATYIFDERGRDVYVFHAIIEDRPLRPGEHFSYRQVTSEERYDSVRRGERNLGQHVIGIALRGASSEEDARELVVRVLKNVIRPGAGPGT
ncbi:MAG TPA: exosortase/archaeosortase family protein [Opitutaceae bacterium]|nr:exosortase/archaeosortase family protein [Opitutaceae bacterium]